MKASWGLLACLLWSSHSWSCMAQLQAASVRSLPTWLSAELAQGGRLQENVELRVEADSNCRLLLGVELSHKAANSGRVIARSGPNGGEIGSSPGSGLPLLPIVLDADARAVLTPLIEWSAEGRALAAGPQSVSIRWLLYEASSLLSEPISTLDTSLVAQVPALLDVTLNFTGVRQDLSGASAMLDFGELTGGARRELEIEIDGNAPARVSVFRQWGELRLETRPEYRIPYSLWLDGHALNQGGAPATVLVEGGVSRLRLSVEIGEVEQRAAGTYQDVITVVVAPE